MQETWVQSQGQLDPLEREMAAHSCLENSVDRGAWQATQSQTQRSDFHFFLHQALGRLSKSKQYCRLVEDNGYALWGENFLKATFESEI